MIIISTKIEDIKIIKPEIFRDERGYFFESFNLKKFNEHLNLNINFIQDNQSISHQGVLRGLHYQKPPYEQAKLVRVLKGEIWDVAIDIRKNSSTYGHWVSRVLSAKNKEQLWIPEGFAHGFYVLSKTAEVFYKVNQIYSKEHEATIHWKNNDFNINWPIYKNKPLISKKDNV